MLEQTIKERKYKDSIFLSRRQTTDITQREGSFTEGQAVESAGANVTEVKATTLLFCTYYSSDLDQRPFHQRKPRARSQLVQW